MSLRQKTNTKNTGGHALMKTKGRKHFVKLANIRWEKWRALKKKK
jgi:hypothetical protein